MGRKSIWRILAWLPAPACLAASIWLWQAQPGGRYLWGQAAATIAFLVSSVVSLFIAWLAAQSYRLSGSKPVLLLGCGTLAFGSVGWIAIPMLRNLNAALTTYIFGILLAGACHLGGAVYTLRHDADAKPRATRWRLYGSYCGTVGLLVLAAVASRRGWLPAVVVEGGGTNRIWQALMVSSAAVFGLSALLLRESYRRTKSDFFFLYALSLAVMMTGLFGMILIGDVRSAANWAGRTTLYLGSIYMLGAVAAAVREAEGWGIALQAALRETRKRYDMLFNTAVEGVLIHESHPSGAAGRIVAANPAICEMLACRQELLLSMQASAIAEPVSEAAAAAEAETLTAKGTLLHEKVLIAGDGRRIRAEISTRAFDSDGSPMLLSVIRDVTARKQHEAALRAANDEILSLNADLERRVAQRTEQMQSVIEELEAFCYSVSHDLRAPLRAIEGFSRLFVEEHGENLPPEALRCHSRVQSNAERMGRIIDDLLAFSRLGRQPMVKEPIQPAVIVAEVLEQFAPECKGRAIELAVGSLPECRADSSLLRQVFVNLLSNALKYTRGVPAVRIEIGSHMEGGEAVYWIKDNGAGFDMRYVGKLFGVFQRLHSADEFEGTGVGLALSQRIIHRHGGRIWATGELNRGAAFFFTLAPA